MIQERGGFKVMLVEDDDGFRLSLAELLISSFPSIVLDVATNGDEAMEKLESFMPHLIFMDIKLPGQNGLKVTRRIKTLYPGINVIVLTNYDFPEYREAARASGACSFLAKGLSSAKEIQDLVKEFWATCVP